MSAISSGMAAAVAQTSLQAQQVARRQDKRKAQTSTDAARLQDMVEARLRALEEGDETQTPAQMRIDGQLPEHQSPSHDRRRDTALSTPPPDDDQPPPPTPPPAHTAKTAASENQLYRHLDIQA